MSFLKACLLLACVLVIQMDTASADISGTFVDKQGLNCQYDVRHIDNKQRQLDVKCKNLKNPKQQYQCSFCGDPHTCGRWYIDNATKYFKNLTSRLAVDPSGACRQGNVSTKKKCSEIVFVPGACQRRVITRGERIVFKEMDITEY